MLTLVALVVAQFRVVEFPAVTPGGVAVNEVMTGGGGFTVTVVVAVVVPPGPVAVIVYVVVVAGETPKDPKDGSVTARLARPGLIDRVVALRTSQSSLEAPPAVIVEGTATKLAMTGGGGAAAWTWMQPSTRASFPFSVVSSTEPARFESAVVAPAGVMTNVIVVPGTADGLSWTFMLRNRSPGAAALDVKAIGSLKFTM